MGLFQPLYWYLALIMRDYVTVGSQAVTLLRLIDRGPIPQMYLHPAVGRMQVVVGCNRQEMSSRDLWQYLSAYLQAISKRSLIKWERLGVIIPCAQLPSMSCAHPTEHAHEH